MTSLEKLCQCSVTHTAELFGVQREPLVFQFVPIASFPALLPHAAFVFLIKLSLSWPIRFSVLFSALVLLRKGSEGRKWE